MSRRRIIAIVIALAGFAGFLLAGGRMARAIADFYAEHGRELYIFQPIMERHFEFAGEPVDIVDTTSDTGSLVVQIRYAGDTVDLAPTLQPGHPDLPGLVRHEDWMRVLRFAPARGLTKAEFQDGLATGDITPRVVILVRRPPLGAGEQTFAQLWRDQWRYEFLELVPHEGIERTILKPPADSDEPPAEGELVPGTWQFEAALGVWGFDPISIMAPHASAGAEPARNAIKAAGLALPIATASLLVAIAALAIGFAPARTTRS